MDAAAHWAAELAGWAVPPALLAAAPASPWGFDVATFRRAAATAATGDGGPSGRAALAALPAGGTILDVGCGGGSAAVPLATRGAGSVVGVDESAAMLEAFATALAALPVTVRTVAGRWPDVARGAGRADVVVCHHVVHNVADLPAFASALTAAARRRVVVEMAAAHPLGWLRPVWRRIHGLDRPEGPTVDDAVGVLRDLGLDVDVELWDGPATWHTVDDDLVAMARRRVCVGPERDREVRAALEEAGRPGMRRPLATLWWEGPPDVARPTPSRRRAVGRRSPHGRRAAR